MIFTRAFKKILIEGLSGYLRTVPPDRDRRGLEARIRHLARDTGVIGHFRTYRTRHGVRLHGDVQDVVTRDLFLYGQWEPTVAALIQSRLKPGDCFVDIGANVGYHTLLASQAVGKQGKVYCFEPVPSTRAMLERNLALNGATNCVVRPEALCDRNGTIAMHAVLSRHTGVSSILNINVENTLIDVPAARLDDLPVLERTATLVKIDVEGAELLVLDGMKSTIQQHRPELIVEISDEQLRTTGKSALDVLGYFKSLDYRVFAVRSDSQGGGLLPEGQVPGGNPMETFDAFFTPNPSFDPASIPFEGTR